MDLASFVFDSADITISGEPTLSSDLLAELLANIYTAWSGTLNDPASKPTAQRLIASVNRNDQGASAVEVLEVIFCRAADAAPLVACTH